MARGRGRSIAAVAAAAAAIFGTAISVEVLAGPGEPAEAVTQAEAEALLAEATRFVREGDEAGLCALRGSTQPTSQCSREATTLGGRIIGQPRIAGFRTTGTLASDDAHPPGAVLELCVPVDGETVYSEFYVVRSPGDNLVAPYPVFWTPRRMEDASESGTIVSSSSDGPPGAHPRC